MDARQQRSSTEGQGAELQTGLKTQVSLTPFLVADAELRG